jgi:septum formation protein
MKYTFGLLCGLIFLLHSSQSFVLVRPTRSMPLAASTDGSSSDLLFSVRDHLGSSVRLILASQSPRRREILDMMGLQGRFEVIPSPLDETALQVKLNGEKKNHPTDYTRILAEEKAKALALHIQHDVQIPTLVLGSDTIVDLGGRILEKPLDAADAKTMLSDLSGRDHEVHTGVAIILVTKDSLSVEASFTDTAHVRFASLSLADIESYIATGEPMDKAGSYGIQGIGGQLVSSLQGDFFTVMGLPMHRVSKQLTIAVKKALAA